MIAEWIGNNEKRFKELLELFLYDSYRVSQRSAWVVSFVAEKHPKLIQNNIQALVNRLFDEGLPVAVKRNVIRVLQFIPVPKNLQAKVMNLCFDFLSDPKETIAVRVFSMTVLANLAKEYPDIKNEIIQVIEAGSKNPSAGYKSRQRKVLKLLEKI